MTSTATGLRRRGRQVQETIDGGIEQDWWDEVLTAGAMWRAAKAEPARADYWTAAAMHYSARANVLLQWDAPCWTRQKRPDVGSVGPFRCLGDEDAPEAHD